MSCVAMSSNGLADGLIHSRSASRASTASFASSHGELPGSANRPSTPQRRQQARLSGTPTRKAKRVRFFRNGDRFFKGVMMPVTPERYRSFDSLLSDVTRLLKDHVNLPNGVRNLFTTDGTKIAEIDELQDGQAYVCSGQGEQFKRIDYQNDGLRKSLNNSTKPRTKISVRENIAPVAALGSGGDTTRYNKPDVIRPRVVTLVRNGVRPRRLIRLLLNKRNAPSFEHALSAITEAVKLDTGAVRKVFTSAGKQLLTLHDFFLVDDLLFVYGSERYSPDDFQLDAEEMKGKQKGGTCSRRARQELLQASAARPKIVRKKPTAGSESRDSDEGRVPLQVRLKYRVGSIVGDGNFAVVRRCTERLKGGEFAMKIIDKSKCRGKEQMIENEVAILRKVQHPNIIRLLAEFDTPTELYLIMELEEGDLFDSIAASTKFPEDEARLMISHMASALAYLHKQDIVHRDIKPENLLVRFDENRRLASLKLGDFGLAQHVTCPLTAICGTPTYVAPEILCEAGYGLKVDIWAAGIIMYILLCGFPPFVSPSDNQEELFDKILIGVFEFTSPYWDDISGEAKDLITCMLQGAPEVRFSAEDVLDHPWLHTDITLDMLNNLTSSRLDSPARKARKPTDCQIMDFSG